MIYEPTLIKASNENGPTLYYAENSGVKIIEKDGLYFKDLEKDGQLHPYEDWRLPAEERAKDLASHMTIEELAGLMQYGSHQFVPGMSNPYWGKVTYGGKEFPEAGVPVYAVTDQQKQWLEKDHVRHLLLAATKTGGDAARWSNNLQAYAESLPHGIPVNNSSDPRHGTAVTFEYDVGAGGDISHWPEPLGLAATFDPKLVEQFGEIASKEYRALGLTTALSPQIDLATEPRWSRFMGTFGESPKLSTELARAYCDGFQTSRGEDEIHDGWGYNSVNAMVKHWPGGGADESGRDAHFGTGKYTVFPGNNFDQHQEPFVDGAFKLKGKTGKASAVMPYYTVAYDQDKENGENVGISYNRYLIETLLRRKHGYDGVVCTDWGILRDPAPVHSLMGGKCWGVEHLTQAERCYKAIMAGVDQFGGLCNTELVMAAYRLGVAEHGEEYMRARFEQSAIRLLMNMFRTGLFENPYLDAEKSAATIGCPEYMAAGFEAQLKSIVMLKNRNHVLPLQVKTKVYIPKLYYPAGADWMGNKFPESWKDAINPALVNKYFELVDSPEEADAAICMVRMPGGENFSTNGYSLQDKEAGGNGYVPISLQYRPYTAEYAREVSIAGGDPNEDFTNRTYKGKSVTSMNEPDIDTVIDLKKAMGEKPMVVLAQLTGPVVMAEYEEYADAILTCVGNLPQALLEICSGKAEPSGLLPMQLPADMKIVEEQLEDVPFDMVCHVDSEGHIYDFGYGMNWNGVIDDERVKKYR